MAGGWRGDAVPLSRMLYVDDSGSVESGLIVYGWIECSPEGWCHALRAILELRKALYRDHGVPASQELHATKFVNGRSRITSRADPRDRTEWKTLGRAVAQQCLRSIASSADIFVGAVYRRTAATGSDYHRERAAVYLRLVQELDAQHRSDGTLALISMDGDGSDPSYHDAHRSLSLDTRHIIEDPVFHDSRRSQLVQMADLVAYTAFCHLNRHAGNVYAWNWYADHLAASDTRRGPRPI